MGPAYVCQPITRVSCWTTLRTVASAQPKRHFTQMTRSPLERADESSQWVRWPQGCRPSSGHDSQGGPKPHRRPLPVSDGDVGMGSDRTPSPQSSASPSMSTQGTGLCRHPSSNSLVFEDPRLPLPCLPARSRFSGLCSPSLRAHLSLSPRYAFQTCSPLPPSWCPQESKRQKPRGALQRCAREHTALPDLGPHITQLHSEAHTGFPGRGPRGPGGGALGFSCFPSWASTHCLEVWEPHVMRTRATHRGG